MNLYEILGVKPNSTIEEIKRAHKEKVKEHHPDLGGNPEVFKKVQEAYEILSDQVSRARYDAGDSIDSIRSSTENQVLSIVLNTFLHVVSGSIDLKSTNVFDEMKKIFKDNRKDLSRHIDKMDKLLSRFQEAKKRIGGNKDSLFKQMLDNGSSQTQAQKKQLQEKDRVFEEAIAFVKDCNYDIDRILQLTGRISFVNGSPVISTPEKT